MVVSCFTYRIGRELISDASLHASASGSESEV